VAADARSVTVVFLAFNRREQLRTSLRAMLDGDDGELLEVVVVDNASSDGTAEMVEGEFPAATLIRRGRNAGVAGWNDGFAVARGDWVLALDDDCYLPAGGLRTALAEARERDAQLVSFSVASSDDPAHRFEQAYRTGLLSFWGCAVLVRREVLEALGGFDPAIFVWAHELEFMLRFFDRGFRHLHLPEVTAIHMKAPADPAGFIRTLNYRLNARHWAYAAAKLLGARYAVAAVLAVVGRALVDAVRLDAAALAAVPQALAGAAAGIRRRAPLRTAGISRVYRHNFECYASPWWLADSPRELLELPRRLFAQLGGRASAALAPAAGPRGRYYERRARYYPTRAATLAF
jgi:GT2 family glycosyltransferase